MKVSMPSTSSQPITLEAGAYNVSGFILLHLLSSQLSIRFFFARQHENEDSSMLRNGGTMASQSAFKQLEKEKKVLETRNKEMEKELALVKKRKTALESRIKELKAQPKKFVSEETETEKRKLAKDLEESNDKIKELMLELSNALTMEKKAKNLQEQLKRKQNAYSNIERDKRTIEKELKESKNQVSYSIPVTFAYGSVHGNNTKARGWVLIGAAKTGQCEEEAYTARRREQKTPASSLRNSDVEGRSSRLIPIAADSGTHD
ncbi:unnamed protein product [Darwinula stevensoni]|uniref:Uncharacterized protein n=1 Tax=Darwinula stevensoni TaxID=69355 RepID=A0A7R8XCP3_9CRUS|nr:unnamed protein product [Darwinula stevensoni]CAG0887785.1 unnamed protein product [Darwinula stevensoni]